MWAIFTFTFVYMDNVDVSLNKPQTAESCEPKDNKKNRKYSTIARSQLIHLVHCHCFA